MSRIYEIQDGFHVDLDRIIALREFIDIEGQGRKRHKHCWIEIYMDCDQIVVVDCNINNLQDQYDMILRAWQAYANQETLY